ncbi:hypothetical protein ACIQUG_08405 [Ensifer sp. NPDC090286]|uniref:hypothetical protein n=1 Tax=Ensifer sp. NPDC090286 TaxID=3363991 RepID=UPI00383AC3FA
MSAETQIPEDIMKAAEEALDNLLCNCVESCGGTAGLRKASIEEIAKAIHDERERCATIANAWKGHPADFHFAGKQVRAEILAGRPADNAAFLARAAASAPAQRDGEYDPQIAADYGFPA